MKNKGKKFFILGMMLVLLFGLWTWLVLHIGVKPVGVNGTKVGFAALNIWFHKTTGVHMGIYNLTDWLGLVPIFVCMAFGCFGFMQLLKRKVDFDIVYLGFYYIIVILCYIGFEMFPVNFRPILINGVMEASYPSSTTLLVLSVMPTFSFQIKRRLKNNVLKKLMVIITIAFSMFMVIGRLVAGVHWITDIIGSVFISTGLFYIYKGIVAMNDEK